MSLVTYHPIVTRPGNLMRDALYSCHLAQHRHRHDTSKVQEASTENTSGNGNTKRGESSSCRQLFPLPGAIFWMELPAQATRREWQTFRPATTAIRVSAQAR